MARVYIPSLLRKYAQDQESLLVPGRTVGEVVRNLGKEFPQLTRELIEDGELKGSLAVAVDGEVAIGGLLEPVREESEIHFMPAISGGLGA